MNRIKKINEIMELVVEGYRKNSYIPTCVKIGQTINEEMEYQSHLDVIFPFRSYCPLHCEAFHDRWTNLYQEQKEHATMARLFALESFK